MGINNLRFAILVSLALNVIAFMRIEIQEFKIRRFIKQLNEEIDKANMEGKMLGEVVKKFIEIIDPLRQDIERFRKNHEIQD